MSNLNINLESVYAAKALHKAIMQAKFTKDADPSLSGSPHLASVANVLVEKMIESCPEEEWGQWRKIDQTRAEWQLIVERIQTSRLWPTWSLGEKNKFIDLLIAPLTITEELRSELLSLRHE